MTTQLNRLLASGRSVIKSLPLPWFIWRLLPHTHGVKDMTFLGMYSPGEYEIWKCNRCKYLESY